MNWAFSKRAIFEMGRVGGAASSRCPEHLLFGLRNRARREAPGAVHSLLPEGNVSRAHPERKRRTSWDQPLPRRRAS